MCRRRISNYEVEEQIGRGTFGIVYRGRNVKTGESVVIKTEPIGSEYSSLRHESTILNIVKSRASHSTPPVYWYGVFSTTRCLVMPYYPETLESIVSGRHRAAADCAEKRIQTRNRIMRSAIFTLKHIHRKYVVHRDIKPANWMVNSNDELVLIDFGLATFYVDSEERHISTSSTTPKMHIVGTPKYASWNVHRGEEYSRRDDLLSLVYIGLYLLEGAALWTTNISIDRSDSGLPKTSILHPMNQWFCGQKTLDRIVAKTGVWPELGELARQVYGLSFQERPGYDEYAELFVEENDINANR